MEKDELINKIKNVKYDLEKARRQLNDARDVLNHSITFNDEGFKPNSISVMQEKIDNQIFIIDNRIIPEIK